MSDSEVVVVVFRDLFSDSEELRLDSVVEVVDSEGVESVAEFESDPEAERTESEDSEFAEVDSDVGCSEVVVVVESKTSGLDSEVVVSVVELVDSGAVEFDREVDSEGGSDEPNSEGGSNESDSEDDDSESFPGRSSSLDSFSGRSNSSESLSVALAASESSSRVFWHGSVSTSFTNVSLHELPPPVGSNR